MLPETLISSYRQYKADTNLIASWLATTAQFFGYSPQLLTQTQIQTENQNQQTQQPPTDKSQSTVPGGGGRLKGKARKLAKEAAANTASTGGPCVETTNMAGTCAKESGAKYKITIKEFLRLAELISGGQTKQTLEVPSWVEAALERAITARKQHSQLLEHKPDPGHTHFVVVLEGVRLLLKPLFTHKSTPKTTKTDKEERDRDRERGRERNGEELENIFSVLEIEEPSEGLSGSSRAPVRGTNRPQEVVYELEENMDLLEYLGVCDNFFSDTIELRNLIMSLWSGYKQGKYDLISVSITTNTAIDMVRKLEEDAMDILNKFGGVEKFYLAYLKWWSDKRGINMDHKEPGDIYNLETYDAHHQMMIIAYMTLDSFVSNFQPNAILVHDSEAGYDLSIDRKDMTHRQKFEEDIFFLSEKLFFLMMPELIIPLKKKITIATNILLFRASSRVLSTLRLDLKKSHRLRRRTRQRTSSRLPNQKSDALDRLRSSNLPGHPPPIKTTHRLGFP
eukprot:TRINITY_DN2618_c0_g1_i1.p1 TRINITY_DN2618_c0_g1~~TRINITY_DN2618_c0_g1_i1.p1  ORF type:complete len:508 (+),score=127.98 TRINITY_DN2618_c0_g1_i1:130-1653(+)